MVDSIQKKKTYADKIPSLAVVLFVQQYIHKFLYRTRSKLVETGIKYVLAELLEDCGAGQLIIVLTKFKEDTTIHSRSASFFSQHIDESNIRDN